MKNYMIILIVILLVSGFLTTHAQISDEFVNIAPEALIYTSGQYSANYPKTALIDEDLSTAWGSSVTDDPQWFYLDFGDFKQIEGYRLHWYDPYFAISYQVFTSDDAKTWTMVNEVTAGTGGMEEVIKALECRYLGVYMTGKNLVAYGIKEFEVLRKKRVTAYFDDRTGVITNVNKAKAPVLCEFNDKLYVSYLDETEGMLRIGVYRDDEIHYVDTNSIFNQNGHWSNVQLLVVNNVLYITWYDTDTLKFARYNGDDDKPQWIELADLANNMKSGTYSFTIYNNMIYCAYKIKSYLVGLYYYDGSEENPQWTLVSTGATDYAINDLSLQINNDTLYLLFKSSVVINFPDVVQYLIIKEFDEASKSWGNLYQNSYDGEIRTIKIFDNVVYRATVLKTENDLYQLRVQSLNLDNPGVDFEPLKNGLYPYITKKDENPIYGVALNIYENKLYIFWSQLLYYDQMDLFEHSRCAVFNHSVYKPEWKFVDYCDFSSTLGMGRCEGFALYEYNNAFYAAYSDASHMTVFRGRNALE